MFLCPNNLLTVYKSAPNVNIMVAWVCLTSMESEWLSKEKQTGEDKT